MGLFDRIRPAAVRAAASERGRRTEEARAVRHHLREFVRTRAGVEAYIEPATAVLPPTVVLVAASGEWTRRRVIDDALVRDLGIPVYDARLVGYPGRMREWNASVRRGEQERGRIDPS
ncbi:MAG TPA: hypothetical protein VI248_07780 [Kineosporiaceae bacterium]